jgi:hypothetical protein
MLYGLQVTKDSQIVQKTVNQESPDKNSPFDFLA